MISCTYILEYFTTLIITTFLYLRLNEKVHSKCIFRTTHSAKHTSTYYFISDKSLVQLYL